MPLIINDPDATRHRRDRYQSTGEYILEVQRRLAWQNIPTDIWLAFVKIMRDWVDKPLGEATVLQRVKQLLDHQHPDLVEGFRQFYHLSYRLNDFAGIFLIPLERTSLRAYMEAADEDLRPIGIWQDVCIRPVYQECLIAFLLNKFRDGQDDQASALRNFEQLFGSQPEVMNWVHTLLPIRFEKASKTTTEERSEEGESGADDDHNEGGVGSLR